MEQTAVKKQTEEKVKQILIDAGVNLGVLAARTGMNDNTVRSKFNANINLYFSIEEMQSLAKTLDELSNELAEAAALLRK